jgi:MYXO-CTERM domain-containing protein
VIFTFVPPADAVQGDLPYSQVPGARAERISHPAAQARLDLQPAWQDFLKAHGPNWNAIWDEATRRPVRFWGEGWDAPPSVDADEESLWKWSEAFLANHTGLLGDGVATDTLRRSTIDRRAGITTVTFTQSYSGLEVFGSRISLRFKAGRFVVGQIESLPGIRIGTSPQITPADARARALARLSWKTERSSFESPPELLIFPVLGEASVRYHLAWRVDVRALDFPANRSVFIDAADGRFLGWHEHNRFITGVVLAEIDNRYPMAGLAEAPMVHVELESPEVEATADELGEFMFADEGPVDVTWQAGSQHWRIANRHNEGQISFTDQLEVDGGLLLAEASTDLGSGATRRVMAQLDAHVSGHIVRARALRINPNFGWGLERAQANVNIPLNDEMPGCNAWFDQNSEVNFLRQGSGCNNTGRIADIMYHEYGHGFHGWSIVPGAGGFDGALSEGLSDYMSATITGDSGMGRNFFIGSTQPLRDIGPDRVWPDDIDGDPHQTGLIIGGALWDLRSLLVDDYGEVAGVDLADHIFWQIASRASSIDTSYVEALLADDDNGDLADGTPNQCLIDEAFGMHGLGPREAGEDSAYFFLTHLRDGIKAPAWDEIVLRADAGLANPDCADGNISHIVLHYSTQGGGNLDDGTSQNLDDWASQIMSATSSDAFEAVLPGSRGGYLLRYRFEAIDDAGEVVAIQPIGSRTDPYFATWVGPRDILWQSDFEEDDGGFSHELLSGPDQEGADDWGWGTPGGRSGDPGLAASGDLIWGNDITPEDNWNGAYQPGVHNVLRSGPLSVGSASTVHLQMRRWLTVEDGIFDAAWIEIGGEVIWSQFSSPSQAEAGQHHEDFHWTFRSYDISHLIGDDGLVEIEWHLESDGGLEMGGWNIDDVALITPGDPGEAPPEFDDGSPGPSFSGTGQGCSCEAVGPAANAQPSLALLLLALPLAWRRRKRA